MSNIGLLVLDVSIEPVDSVLEEDSFRITWKEEGAGEPVSFVSRIEGRIERILKDWDNARDLMEIGQILFRFIEGGEEIRFLSRVLERARLVRKKVLIYLRACREVADWPFELVADHGVFLALNDIHLVRRVSDRGSESKPIASKEKINLLFMATDYIGKDSGLMYGKEEEKVKKICEIFPIEMDVIDTGHLQGLQDRLEKKYYDIVHITGHGSIQGETPVFYMNDISGGSKTVNPEKFWEGALIENPPQVLFLSGCRTGQLTKIDKTKDIESFAKLMVDQYKLPVVLGWGREINDVLAIYCAEMIYEVIGQQLSMLNAVQNARIFMIKKREEHLKESARLIPHGWHLLRLYSNGLPFSPFLKGGKIKKTEISDEPRIYLPLSSIKVLKKGFIGRRTQLQVAMDALAGNNHDQIGVLILGPWGIGKSCLVGKICERFSDHVPVVIEGTFDNNSLKTAIERVFKSTNYTEGLKKLERDWPMTDILADLCTSVFKDRSYMIILDGFEKNLIASEGDFLRNLDGEAMELINSLLYYLPLGGKTSKLIITSRFSFTFTGRGARNFEEQVKKVWLNGFNNSEIEQKFLEFGIVFNKRDESVKNTMINSTAGNPLLIERIARIPVEILTGNILQLEEEIKKIQDDFIREFRFDLFYRQCSEDLIKLLDGFKIYKNPIREGQMDYIAKKAGLNEWQSFLQEGVNLGLVERNQANNTYVLSPLMKRIFEIFS